MPNTKAASCGDCKVVRWLGEAGDIELCSLHAAAPELLEALLSLTNAYGAIDGRNGNSGECWNLAREAIRKAESK